MSGNNPANKTLTLTRLLDAPVEKVFALWIEAEHLAQWFAPKHFTVHDCRVDARLGGEIYLVMQGPDGERYPMKATFEELVRPCAKQDGRIVTRNWAGLDAEGRPGFETLQTYSFVAEGDRTQLTVRAEVIWAQPHMAPAIAGMDQGWAETLDKLAAVAKNV